MSAQTKALKLTPKMKRSHLLSVPWLFYVVAILLSVTFLFPLFWMASTSLKTMGQAYTFPPVWLPHPVQWSNFAELFTELPFLTFTINSVMITVLNTLGVVLASAVVAFGFSRLPRKAAISCSSS